MVHAENHDMLDWMGSRLVDEAILSRAITPHHDQAAERRAINRAISLARLADAPLFIVHVSTPGGAENVRERAAGGRSGRDVPTISVSHAR